MSDLNDPLANYYVSDEQVKEEEAKEAAAILTQEQEAVKEPVKEDPLAQFYVEEETEEDAVKKAAGPYYVPEKSKEELKNMTLSEKRQYIEDMNVMREYLQSKGFTKGALSALSFGGSEKIPGLKQEKGELLGGFGELVGSLAPIGAFAKGAYQALRFFSYPVRAAAKNSPTLLRGIDALTGITSMGLAGGAYHTAETVVKEGELPSTNDVLKHGFEWAALDGALRGALKAGEFAYSVAKTAKKTSQPEWKVVNDVLTEMKEQGVDIKTSDRTAAKAMSIIEDMAEGKAPEGKTVREVKPKQFKEMDNALDQLAEPILPEAREPTTSVNTLVENMEEKAIRNEIDSVGRRALDDAELGREVQEGVIRAREQARAEYKPFYDEVEEGARYITTNPQRTAREAGQLVQVLEELRTRPSGYSTVINALEDVLQDAGYVVQRAENGAIELIVQESEAPLTRLLELGRRLNEIAEYDVLDRTIRDRINPIARAVKQDIRSALGAYDKDLLASFELAEEAFAINAEKFGRDSIRKIRKGEALEAIPKALESATGLNDLRAVVQPSTMKNVERQLLEKMNKMTHAKAEEFLRKVRSGLSQQSQHIADQIVQSKVPINKQSIKGRTDRMHEAIDEDLTTAMNTGQRPKKVLDLWQNERGQKLVKDAVKTHPQKAEILDYLQKQTLQDMARTVVSRDGTVNLEKLNELMKNPALRNNLEQLGGKEAVEFFDQLSAKAKNLKKNTQELVVEKLGKPSGEKGKFETPQMKSKGERGQAMLKKKAAKDYPLATKIQNFLDFLGVSGKITLNLFTLMKFGLVKGIMAPVATKIIQKMATSPRVRKAFTKASQRNLDTKAFIAAIEELDRALDEGD